MNRRRLEHDPIFIYLSDKFESIGIDPPILSIEYNVAGQSENDPPVAKQQPIHGDLIDYYLTMYDGFALFHLFKILNYLRNNPVPENIKQETTTQIIKYFDPINVLDQMIIHIRYEKLDRFPDEFEQLFGLVYHFGYIRKPTHSFQITQIRDMLDQI